jgi:hypothetical protein
MQHLSTDASFGRLSYWLLHPLLVPELLSQQFQSHVLVLGRAALHWLDMDVVSVG